MKLPMIGVTPRQEKPWAMIEWEKSRASEGLTMEPKDCPVATCTETGVCCGLCLGVSTAPGTYTGFVHEPIEIVEADREETPEYRKWYASLCDCTCAGSECPAGKMGSMTRCSTEDLRVLALKLRSEARRLSLAVATATRDRDAALAALKRALSDLEWERSMVVRLRAEIDRLTNT